PRGKKTSRVLAANATQFRIIASLRKNAFDNRVEEVGLQMRGECNQQQGRLSHRQPVLQNKVRQREAPAVYRRQRRLGNAFHSRLILTEPVLNKLPDEIQFIYISGPFHDVLCHTCQRLRDCCISGRCWKVTNGRNHISEAGAELRTHIVALTCRQGSMGRIVTFAKSHVPQLVSQVIAVWIRILLVDSDHSVVSPRISRVERLVLRYGYTAA